MVPVKGSVVTLRMMEAGGLSAQGVRVGTIVLTVDGEGFRQWMYDRGLVYDFSETSVDRDRRGRGSVCGGPFWCG